MANSGYETDYANADFRLKLDLKEEKINELENQIDLLNKKLKEMKMRPIDSSRASIL